MLVLYYKASCPYSLRIRLALSEKELPFERRVVGEEKPPELVEISGGRVPVFLENSLAIRHSSAIAEYLEERFPTPALLPSEARDRALVRMAMLDLDAVLDRIERLAPEEVEAARPSLLQGLDRIEAKLGDAGTLFGMECTLADLWLLSTVEAAAHRGLDFAREKPLLRPWLAKMRARKSVRQEPLAAHG